MKPFASMAAVFALSLSAIGANAADFGQQPANYQAAAEAYIAQRLSNPNLADIRIVSAPYQVSVDDLPCWAVDARVKASSGGGGFDRFANVTVLFHEGAPFATKSDVSDFARLDGGDRVARM
ncbi:MAG: hypothetical protein K2Q06_04100 [Parvularculaceae bacterium]|nr:hypothetical protein [Parvularculaceae bacterium]